MSDYTNREDYEAAMQNWQREQQQGDRLQLQQQAQQFELQRVQEKAQFDAELFEKRYTTEQTNQLSKFNGYMQWVDSNPDFSPDEKKRAREKIELLKLGINPTDLPRLSKFPKGRGPGDYFEEGGIGWTIDKDGQRKEVDERGSIRGQAFKAKAAMNDYTLKAQDLRETEERKLRAGYDEDRRKYIAGLMKDDIETGEMVQQKNSSGKLVDVPVTRKRNFREASNMALELYPSLAPNAQGQQKPQQSRGRSRQDRVGEVSPGGKYVWDGTKWVPNKKR